MKKYYATFKNLITFEDFAVLKRLLDLINMLFYTYKWDKNIIYTKILIIVILVKMKHYQNIYLDFSYNNPNSFSCKIISTLINKYAEILI